MGKRPRLIVNKATKPEKRISSHSHWLHKLHEKHKPRKLMFFVSIAVLAAIVMLPLYARSDFKQYFGKDSCICWPDDLALKASDGDTIHCNSEKIRIANIDAPEGRVATQGKRWFQDVSNRSSQPPYHIRRSSPSRRMNWW